MTTINTTYTASSLNELSLVTITKINNNFANLTAGKETKRFATKPAAIAKCLANQLEFNTQFPPKKVEKVKPVEVKSDFLNMKLSLNVDFDSSKKGSLQDCIFRAIRSFGQDEETEEVSNTVSDIVFEVIRTYERPRSEKNVDEAFAIRKIKRLVKKGRLTLSNNLSPL